MSYQITVTLGKADHELAEFVIKQERLSRIDEITGIHLRNQLYARMRTAKGEV